MLYREIIAVCSQIYTEHINTLCGHNGEFVNVKLAVHKVPLAFQGLRMCGVLLSVSIRLDVLCQNRPYIRPSIVLLDLFSQRNRESG